MKTAASPRLPIPVLINAIAIVGYSSCYFLLLYLASHARSASGLIICSFAFAVNMIPIYSLIHEAEHRMLLPNLRWNDCCGQWLCALFIVSFTFFKHCHLRHHKKNRTDIEMWDMYSDHQARWARRSNLYLMLSGFGYFLIWLSVVLFAAAPSTIYRGLFQRHTEIAGFLEGSDQPRKLRAIRRECWAVLAFQATVLLWLQFHVGAWLTVFAIHGFVWSSQNYVNHAYSPRDIVNGAHNLRVPAWLKPIYLNFNLHLAHHQNPHVPWVHLPALVVPGSQRMSFFYNYLRLWCGPRLTRERNPAPSAHVAD
jgi:fatty acid desaturase